jgi:MoaA/NifB/PqqE/SkfB family radical SAM enzyme
VDSVIWKENYEHLDKFVDFCEKLGVDEIIFAWPIKVGKAAQNYHIIFPPEERYLSIGKKLEELKKNKKIRVSYHRFAQFGDDCEDCLGGRKIFYINSVGNISPCFWISTLFSEFFTGKSIFEENLCDLLKEEAVEDFMKMEEERYKKFGPGCPAVCVIENGTFYSKDPLLKNVNKNT